MAFQPIVDAETARVFAYEALVRGPENQSAASILAQVNPENQYQFDQSCRVAALRLATKLGLPETGAALSINFMPGAVYSPSACIQLTLKTARELGFPMDRLIFEITEAEEVQDPGHLSHIIEEYHRQGFRTAIDDFGAGYAGVNLLAEIRSEIVKLDMELTRNIHRRPRALAIVRSMVALCQSLGSEVVAEGIETVEEYGALRACGVRLLQGYLLARPSFESLPAFVLPPSEMDHRRSVRGGTAQAEGSQSFRGPESGMFAILS